MVQIVYKPHPHKISWENEGWVVILSGWQRDTILIGYRVPITDSMYE